MGLVDNVRSIVHFLNKLYSKKSTSEWSDSAMDNMLLSLLLEVSNALAYF